MVVARVQLADPGVDPVVQLGHLGMGLAAGRHDHVVGVVGAVVGEHAPAAPGPALDGRDRDTAVDPDAEPAGVVLVVLRELCRGREGGRRAREREPGQSAAPGRGVEEQRVVPVTPLVAHAPVPLEDDAAVALEPQAVRRREAGLARADDHGGDVLPWRRLDDLGDAGSDGRLGHGASLGRDDDRRKDRRRAASGELPIPCRATWVVLCRARVRPDGGRRRTRWRRPATRSRAWCRCSTGAGRPSSR